MNKKLIFTNGVCLKRLSLSKKLTAFFIFACMAVNGFIPGMAETAKSSFVLQSGYVAYEAVSKIFKHCNDSLAVISDKVAKDFLKIFSIPVSDVQTTDKKESGGSDESAQNCPMTFAVAASTRSAEEFVDVIGHLLDGVYVYASKLFILYMNFKIGLCGGGNSTTGGILFLISCLAFIAVIIRRKIFASSAFFSFDNSGKMKISA
jgi:hypothetical protein